MERKKVRWKREMGEGQRVRDGGNEEVKWVEREMGRQRGRERWRE